MYLFIYLFIYINKCLVKQYSIDKQLNMVRIQGDIKSMVQATTFKRAFFCRPS